MTEVTMKLISETLKDGDQLTCDGQHIALFVISGGLSVAGHPVAAGDGIHVDGSTDDIVSANAETEVLQFIVDPDSSAGTPSANGRLICEASFELPQGGQFLRLDQVAFPPGASAYRHVHPGAGIRFLTKGTLDIQSDHGVEQMAAGIAWFEDANSPVKATASHSRPTAFVRGMVLPIDFLGKPTITYLNPSDGAKPKLQTNTRFFDQQIEF